MFRQMLSVSIVLLAALIVGSSLTPSHPAPATAHQASPAASTPCPATSEDENEALIRRYREEVWGQGRVEVLEEVLAADYVAHIPGIGASLQAAEVPRADLAAAAESIREVRTDFPDLRVTIEDILAEGDRVAVRMTFAGTQADPLDAWNAPDTGRRMEREVWSFYRIACGKIAEAWFLPDNLTLLRQLGIITDEELRDAGTPTAATPVP